MNYLNHGRQKIINFCCILFLIFYGYDSYAQSLYFDINEPLTSSQGNIEERLYIEGTAKLTSGGIDEEGKGWLRLTNAAKREKGYVIVKQSFPSNLGVIVDFEFSIWGGDGADGISVFLFDSKYSLDYDENNPYKFKLGADGSGLGYAHAGVAGGKNDMKDGVSGGFLGVGFDTYGYFGNPYDGLIGGFTTNEKHKSPHSVVIRGKKDEVRSKSFRFLGGEDKVGQRFGISNFTLDYKDGNNSGRPLSNDYYRRAIIEFTPKKVNNKLEYYVAVKLKVKENGEFVKVVDDIKIEDELPESFNLGIAGITGGQFNYHEIRNLRITAPGDVSVSVSSDKDQVYVDDELIYDITLSNDSSVDLENLLLNAVIPENLEVISYDLIDNDNEKNMIISPINDFDFSEVYIGLASYSSAVLKIKTKVKKLPKDTDNIVFNVHFSSNEQIYDPNTENDTAENIVKVMKSYIRSNKNIDNYIKK